MNSHYRRIWLEVYRLALHTFKDIDKAKKAADAAVERLQAAEKENAGG